MNSVLPRPASLDAFPGAFRFNEETAVEFQCGNVELRESAELLAEILRPPSGLPLPVRPAATAEPRTNTVLLSTAGANLTAGEEAYALEVTPRGVVLRAPRPAGAARGVMTLRQLLPPQVELRDKAEGVRWLLPALRIEDSPRFPWRGMHLDVSRHFFGIDSVKRFVDLCALHKMNTFHWHLIDDGGWRLEIRCYPRLTELGAWRYGCLGDWDHTAIRFPVSAADRDSREVYGGWYTQEEVREVVDYARRRSVRVVPEIEMPGHCLPALVAYPELCCRGVSPENCEWGYYHQNMFCAGKEETFEFLWNVLEEAIDLFPDEYVHIGADEVSKFFWKRCPDCGLRMREEGLRDTGELQSYFVRRVERYLNGKGRRLIGWDEILEGGLAPNATVMSWRGMDGGIAAARAGHDVIMTPGSHCYFDASYANTTTEKVYSFEPVAVALDEAERPRVLGAQANVWTEWMNDFERVEYMCMPRAIAMAEVLWTAQEGRDYDDFVRRLVTYYDRLDLMQLHYHIPAPMPDFSAVVFKDRGEVRFDPASIPQGWLLHWTDDGTEPDEWSPVYESPIVADRAMTVKARYITAQGTRSEIAEVDCRPFFPVQAPGELEPGLRVACIEGEFSAVPPAGTADVSKTAVVERVDIDPRTRDFHYALHFSGYIKVPTDGAWTFQTSSDDGSMLSIAGARVVNNDGLHGCVGVTGRVRLKAGLYPLEIGYFQAGGDQCLEVQVEGPGVSMQSLPRSMLRRTAAGDVVVKHNGGTT